MPDVLTFGELMLRLTTPGFQRFAQAAQFDIHFGGAEANVAVAIAQLGGSAGFFTKLPRNELADRALRELHGHGVDVSRVARGGERMGVYFLEHGAGHRAGKVVYDRKYSAIAEARSDEFDWAKILAGVRWFHWSGITAALSDHAADMIAQACETARSMGITVSFDVNYRSKLWAPERAGAVLAPLMKHVDLCVSSTEELRSIFKIDVPAESKDREIAAARQVQERFGVHRVALTMRQAETAGSTRWAAMLYAGSEAYFSKSYDVTIVDRLGAGDSFSGALIFALHRGDGPREALELAVAASCLKHTVAGDYNLVSLAEVEALAAGRHGGRVQR